MKVYALIVSEIEWVTWGKWLFDKRHCIGSSEERSGWHQGGKCHKSWEKTCTSDDL